MSETQAKEQDLSGVTLLGNQNTKYKFDYDPTILEKFERKFEESQEDEQVVSLDCFEFVSRCVTGDTLVDVARNEEMYPQGVPIRDLVGTEGYVYSVDPETLMPVVKKYRDVRCTGKNREVVKVTMEYRGPHGSRSVLTSITCTPDHLFLVKKGFNGSMWVKAEDLVPDMRLIADQHTAGTDSFRANKSRHRLLGEAIFGNIDGYDIHHINGVHLDNRPENLQKLTTSEHQHLHRSQDYGYDDTLDINELVRLYESGENFSSIAKMFDCDVSTIYSRISHLVNKRTQAESLLLVNRTDDIINRNKEICELYQTGYLIKEISDYMQLDSTAVSNVLKENEVQIISSNVAKQRRMELELPPLNHRVVSVEPAGVSDVYNMEVDDTHCFFANGVVIHNCPRTGQPDLATIHINYIANQYLVESKSLKLYLFSFQQHGDFHESCISMIMNDLVELLNPRYLEVYGDFNSRGGVSILPFSVYADENHQEMKKARQLSMMQYSCEHRPRTS